MERQPLVHEAARYRAQRQMFFKGYSRTEPERTVGRRLWKMRVSTPHLQIGCRRGTPYPPSTAECPQTVGNGKSPESAAPHWPVDQHPGLDGIVLRVSGIGHDQGVDPSETLISASRAEH